MVFLMQTEVVFFLIQKCFDYCLKGFSLPFYEKGGGIPQKSLRKCENYKMVKSNYKSTRSSFFLLPIFSVGISVH